MESILHFTILFAFLCTQILLVDSNATRRKNIFRTFNLVSADYNIVCLYGDESFKKKDFLSNIKKIVNPYCTFHIYSYNTIDYDQYINGSFGFITTVNAKKEEQLMELFTDAIRQKSMKDARVLISVGNSSLLLNDFMSIVKNVNYTKFANDAIDFYTTNDFDGLNFQFAIGKNDSIRNETSHVLHTFITNLKEELSKTTFTFKLPVFQLAITIYFESLNEFKNLNIMNDFLKIFDIINIVPFNINKFSFESNVTKFFLPLYSPNNLTEISFSDLVDGILDSSIPRHKIIFAIPLFGSSFKLKNYYQDKLGDAVIGLGKPGKSTQKSGFLSYYEICHNLNKYGSKIRVWNDNYMAPYLHYSDQWISYEDEESIAYKIRYLKCNGVRGAMLFAVDFDDYKNECGKNYSSVNFSPLGVIINKEILNDDWSVCMSQTINRKKMNTNSTLKSAQFKVGKYPVTLPKENPTFVGPKVCEIAENNNKFSADANDCRIFYQCNNLQAHKRKCPSNLAFNNKINVCDFKVNVKNCK